MKVQTIEILIYEVDDRVETPLGSGTIVEVPDIKTHEESVYKAYTIKLDEPSKGRSQAFYQTQFLSLIK